MLTSDIQSIQKNMNEYGKAKIPFLFAINFEKTEGFFIENPCQQSQVLFQMQGKGNKTEVIPSIPKNYLHISPIGIQAYQKKFDKVFYHLHQGNSFLTNLTVKTPIQTNLSLKEIFLLSTSPYQLFFPERFICFSPERFVKISGNTIYTHPMKGTIDASIPNAEKIILNDSKEKAEHSTVVDLLRNDLGMVATQVQVNKYRYIDRISTRNKEILQVSSQISGILPEPQQLGDIIFTMLPAGSVSGAPKRATLQIIKEAEKEPRGFYTGIFGYFDGEELDTAVLIRFIEQDQQQLFFRSGGGITVYSDCKKEYDEVLHKIYFPFI